MFPFDDVIMLVIEMKEFIPAKRIYVHGIYWNPFIYIGDITFEIHVTDSRFNNTFHQTSNPTETHINLLKHEYSRVVWNTPVHFTREI